MMEIAVCVDETGNFVFRSDRTPAVIDAFAGERKVQAEIEIGMRFRVVGDFREPRARHHDAGRVDETGVEGFDGRGIHGMRYADVIGVNNQQLRIAGVAKLFGKRLAVVLREKLRCRAQENQEQDEVVMRFHAVPKIQPIAGELNSTAGRGDFGI
jgi:hypothetical protein